VAAATILPPNRLTHQTVSCQLEYDRRRPTRTTPAGSRRPRRRGHRQVRRVVRRLANWLYALGGPDGAYGLGRRRIRQRRYEEAAAWFGRAEREYCARSGASSSRVIEAMSQRAWCLVALGRPSEGAEVYRAALDRRLLREDDLLPASSELSRLLADAEQRAQLAMIERFDELALVGRLESLSPALRAALPALVLSACCRRTGGGPSRPAGGTSTT